jgi:uncharacterized membrane protein YfcA
MVKGEKREELFWLLVGTVGSAVAGILVGWLTGNIYAVIAIGVLTATIIQRLKRMREDKTRKKPSERGRETSSKGSSQ